jgi:hypothetical protein
MKFHGALVDAQVGGYLFVELALHHVPEDLAFTVAQQLVFVPCGAMTGSIRVLLPVARERAFHGRDQIFPGRVLAQEIFGPAAHGADRRRDVPMTAQKYDRQGVSSMTKRFLQRQAIEAGHYEVCDYTAHGIRLQHLQKLGGGIVDHDFETRSAEQTRH